jgi:hypothetical protein
VRKHGGASAAPASALPKPQPFRTQHTGLPDAPPRGRAQASRPARPVRPGSPVGAGRRPPGSR